MSSIINYTEDFRKMELSSTRSQKIIRSVIEKIKDKGIPKLIYVGLIMIFISASVLMFQPYEKIFEKTMIFSKGGISYMYWQSSKVHLELKAFLFNITNKEAFLKGEEKLKLNEVGPEVAIHQNTTFHHENGIISSNPRYSLQWIPEQIRNEDDIFTLPHVAMLLFSSKVVETSNLLKLAINTFIMQTDSQPIVQQTAKEYFFGYENAFTKFGHTLMPHWIKFDKIGLLDQLYDHEGDSATTFTGETNLHLTGLFQTYNDQSHLQHWESPCNKLAGSSDGKKFGNYISMNDTVYLYRKGMCRSVPMIPIGTTVINGISSVVYDFEENVFDNGNVNSRNKCFCRNEQCLPNTVQDITDCYYGFRVAVSFPHFYKGDPSLRDKFDGLEPNATKHQSRLFVEPNTGYVTSGYIRLQLNAILGDLSGVSHCQYFSNMILPMAWIQLELRQLDPVLNIALIMILRILPLIEVALAYLLLLIGILLTIFSLRTLIYDSENID